MEKPQHLPGSWSSKRLMLLPRLPSLLSTACGSSRSRVVCTYSHLQDSLSLCSSRPSSAYRILPSRHQLRNIDSLEMSKSKVDYENDDAWADVVPIPQDEGGANPLAVIAYTDEYSQAMSYLRAVMASNEKSLRVMELTEHIISMNPAHYTVW